MKDRKIHIHCGLLPLSFLYGIGVKIRNRLFDSGILKSRSFPVPIISVGNLAVGGTGKTPHTEYLIRLLKPTFKVAVLSRGYKRESKGFVLASRQTTVKDIGDEPWQMAHKFPDINVAVDRNRCHGIEQLTQGCLKEKPEAIILDDAFQHRYVSPGLSILLTDYNRPFFSDQMLPAGRLREPAAGKRRADIIIVTKCPDHLDEKEICLLRKKIAPADKQTLYFTRMAYGMLQPLSPEAPARDIRSLSGTDVILVTGIASPAPIMKKLSAYTRHIVSITFGDHHAFSAKDIERIQQAFRQCKAAGKLIITTEKDAARLACHPLLDETTRKNTYTLPITVEFINEKEKQSFNSQIISYVRKDSRNSSLSEG